MQSDAAVATLTSLHLPNAAQAVASVEDGAASLLQTDSGATIALLRRGDEYDSLVLGSSTECPVPSLRAILERAVLPLSDSYAAGIGVAVPERDAIRKRIREASVALDVIGKGRRFSVAPPLFPVHTEIRRRVDQGLDSVNQLPDELFDDLALINQLQGNVVAWSKEIDRVVQASTTKTDTVLSVEEETVFWSSLDAALSVAQEKLASKTVRISLDVLARNRRATGFLIDAKNSIDTARRKAGGVLTLVQGLPLVALRSADDFDVLQSAVTDLLDHVGAKLRVSSFSVERVLGLIESVAEDVSRAIGRVLARKGGVLVITFDRFVHLFECCCKLFETWSRGFDHCRKVARDSAHKKGETMPPRRTSPLSHLHSHLSDIYELRSDHEVSWSVLHDLLKNLPSAGRKIDCLESAYTWLVKECETLDHFEASPARDKHWTEVTSSYRLQIKDVEQFLSAAYEEIAKKGSSIHQLAQSLQPLLRILEKHFISSAITNSIPTILGLARADFTRLKRRDLSNSQPYRNSPLQDVPNIVDALSQRRLVRTRASNLLASIYNVVGKTVADISPDLQDFVAEVNSLKDRSDPAESLSTWLSTIQMNMQNLNLYRVERGEGVGPQVGLSLTVDVTSFHVVLRTARDDRELSLLLTAQHHKFARVTKSLFPVVATLRDALAAYHCACDKLKEARDSTYHRTTPLLSVQRGKAQKVIEEGLLMPWTDSILKLQSHAGELSSKCSAFLRDVSNLLEKDAAMKNAVQDILLLDLQFSEAEISSESMSQLQTLIRRFKVASVHLHQAFNETSVHAYILTYCVPRLNDALLKCLERVMVNWVSAVRSAKLRVPSIVVEAMPRNSSREGIWCTPAVGEVESFLLCSIGSIYTAIANVIHQTSQENEGICTTCDTDFGNLFVHQHLRDSKKLLCSPYELIQRSVERVSDRVRRWAEYLQFLDPELPAIVSQYDETSESAVDVLETLTGTYEAVIALRRETETAADRHRVLEDCIRLDVSDLSGRISSNILETLSLFCDETTSSFSQKSQVLYQTISDAKESILEATTSDGTEKLLSLQTLKENLIPLSTSSIESLAELESKFEEIAERIGDFSFSRARSAESWIVSEELNAHLKSLLDLHEQRSASILQNHDILQSNYQSSISRYQESLAEAFDNFQKIRSSDRTKDTSTVGIGDLDELERRLDDLCLEGLNLERVGRALCSSQLPDRTGALSIIAEVKRVRAGVEKLKVLEENVDAVGLTTIKDVSPSSLRESLDRWSSEATSIGNLSGAIREAGCFKTRISRYLQSHGTLTKLHSVQLSAVRERDLLRRLFGEKEATKSIGRISLKVFWDAKVSDHGKYLREVFENAAGEASVAEFFSSIDRSWTARKCAFVKLGGVLLLQGIPELTDELEEHLQALETMSGSPYARLFESDRAAWEMRLAKCREELEILSQVQSRWAHMRTLFGSGGRSGVSGLRMELQDEFNAFSNVHARFSSLGERMEAAPGILEGLEIPSGLNEMEEELVGILRGLSTFLEKQRSRFPRFFFLSDSDLLQVLSVTIDSVEGLLLHISKLFPGVGTFKFQKHASAVQIDSVSSKEGEVIVFPRPIILAAKEQFSTWLEKIQEALGEYLRNSLRPAIQVLSQLYHNDSRDYKVQAIKKYMDFPAQLSLLAIKICFTQKVETCLEEPLDANHTLEKLRDFVKNILDLLCSHDIDIDNAQLHRRKIRAAKDQLIKEFVYQRDLLSSLCAASVKSASSHHWNHELRFYSNTVGETGTAADVLIRCGKGEFRYGWEYLGVGETLVHTPLTSRSYLALSEALRRGLGGSPFGPAGTGKTETVKALGRMLGRFVAVFNCDESFDSVSVGRILAGACRVGSWVCFDEFNRLSASILSATSGQLANLQTSIRKGERAVKNFYGGELPVSITPGVGVFVTMNPTYSGRRELPANLKSLFRPCSMSKPDSLVITEVLLLSQGFKASGGLSRKLVSLFQNLKATLPSRAHYDFGLRSLKSTIMASRSLLQSQHPRANLDEGLREGAEQDVLIRALGENLKPKLNGRDVSVYERAISVVFTEATCYIPRLPQEIEDILECVLVENQLLKDCRLVEKIRQLHSLLKHQRGVMLVGPTGSGKSTAWRTLHDAMIRFSHVSNQGNNEDQKQIRSSLTVIDAKLLTSQQLYGGLDRVTREWSDGLFTKTLRSLSEGGPANRCEDSYPLDWIVFDGDVDPDWVENLNSVLDDNRILTLPNGEQVPLPEHARIIFETEHLKHANPSTVSRCGMVCFDESYSVEEKLYTSILSLLHEIEPQCAPPSCLHGVAKCAVGIARCVEGDGKLVMQVPLQSMVDSIALLLRNNLLTMKQQPSRAFLAEEEEDEKEEKNGSGSYIEISPSVFLRTLLVAIGKSLCCGLVRSKQCEVTQMLWDGIDGFEDVRSAIDGTIRPPNLAEVAMTPHGFYRDYHEMVPSRDSLIRCQDIGSPDVVVPTPTTVQLESLIQESLNLRNEDWVRPSPIILCGPPGCGKSMLLSASLREAPNVSLATLSFSAETSPAHILAALRSHTSITKRPNGSLVLHPKSTGSRVVLFCDEVNLAKPDCYETQAAICLLRSLSEHMGFWQGSPPTWISIRGVQIVAACNPDEDTGRHQLSSRFLRHCRLVRVEQPHPRDISVIYGVFVQSLLRSLDPRFEEKSSDMTAAMVEFFSLNTEKFCPPQSGPLQPHYIYSPRDLSRWIRGMRQLLPAESRPLADGAFETSDHTEYSWTEVVAAFCYEARRIFCDRLLLKEEQSFADNALREIVKRVLHVSAEPTSVQLYSSWLSNDDESCSERRFRIVSNPGQFRTLIYRKLRVFAEEEGLGGSWMGSNGSQGLEDASTMIDQFAVTDDVLTHLTRLDRVLNQPLGHAVLMGAPGTGKKTLARFAAWMLSTEVHQVHSHSAYTAADFAGDLRKILRQAGVNSRQIMLIFDESNAMDSAFLEMMNSLLACGEVPGLFSGDERARLLEDLKTSASGTTTGPNTEQSIYAEFVRRVRLNLHIVFTISTGCSRKVLSDKNYQRTVGGNLSQRSPALFNRCMVDWLGDWNPETLEAVAELKIEVSLGHEKDQIIRSAVRIHDIARKFPSFARAQVDVTPRHYLEFIEQLNRLALEKGKAIQGGVDRHTEGLRRLRNAGNAADVLKDELREKSERLQEKEVNANQTLERMVEEQRMAEKSKVDAEHLAVAAQEASLRVREREDEVSAQLAAVLPKVEAARDAVGSIRREFLEEIRAMPHPPAPVRIALEGVLMILDATSMGRGGGANYTWNNIRSRMRGSEFITTVVNFDAESLPRGARGLIEKKIIQNPDFDVNRITYASRAAGPLAEWTISVLDYATVKEDISPMQKEVLVLQEEQEELLGKQEDALEEVAILQQRIQDCRAEYALLVSEAEKVRQEIKESEESLMKSEDMLDSLAQEWDRWVKELNSFNAAAVTVWGNAVYAAAFVAYAGVLDHVSRSQICEQWKEVMNGEGIPFDEKMSLSEFLTSAEERGLWSAQGLPTDCTSLENYAILKRSARFPLVIDPSRNGSSLLRKVLGYTSSGDNLENRDKPSNAEAVRISESSFSAKGKKSYMRSLESAMRFGTSIFLEDAEKFDRAVTPLLGQESSYGDSSELVHSMSTDPKSSASTRGGTRMRSNICQRVVRLGDRDVFLSSSFRLYMIGGNIQNIPTAAVTRSNVVSFDLSPAALHASCVSRALRILSPELEEKRKASLAARQAYQRRKHELEESVLSAITDVEDLGTELLGGSLLDSLTRLKQEVELIVTRQEEEAKSFKSISEAESSLEGLGRLAVDLFGVLQSLVHLNPVYQFPISIFLRLFDESLLSNTVKLSAKGNIAEACQHRVVEKAFYYIAPSLFPQDRLPFACALAIVTSSYMHGSNAASELDCMMRIRHAMQNALDAAPKGQLPLHEHGRNKVLKSLPSHLQSQVGIHDKGRETETFSTAQGALRVLSTTLLEPHCLFESINILACTLPGGQSLVHSKGTNSVTSLHQTLKSFAVSQGAKPSSKVTLQRPLLLCARGENSDPATIVADIANQLRISTISVAMGGTHTAESVTGVISRAFEQGEEGRRVLLMFKNMHLASKAATECLQSEIAKRKGLLPFLCVLVIEVSSQFSGAQVSATAPFFRLLAFEAPPSFRDNFSSAMDKIAAICQHSIHVWKDGDVNVESYQIATSWLHASLVERSAHAPIGFSKCYDFSESDLIASWEIVSSRLAKAPRSQDAMSAIAHMLTNAIYGCRIELDADLDIVRAVVGDIFSAERLVPSSKTGTVKVLDGSKYGTIPLNNDERKQHIRDMPLQAPPWWTHMPFDTKRRMQTVEGRSALAKMLTLSEKKFCALEKDLGPVSELKHTSSQSTDSIIDLAEGLSAVKPVAILSEFPSPLELYTEAESNLLFEITQTVLQDVEDVFIDRTKTVKPKSRIARLRKDLLEGGDSNQVKVPGAWTGLSCYFGSGLPVSSFFSKLKDATEAVGKIKESSDIYIAAVPRPAALLEAMKYDHAMSQGISPTSIAGVLTGQSDNISGSRRLVGAHLSRGEWNPVKGVFTVGYEGKVEAKDLFLSWISRNEGPEKENKTYVQIPLYGRGFQGVFLTSLEIPVDGNSSRQDWRLCGASVSLD